MARAAAEFFKKMARTNRTQALHIKRSRRGFPQRPPRTQARTISTHFSAETMQALDAYISSLPDPKPAQTKVVNRGVREWLTSLGLLSPEANKKARQVPEAPAGPAANGLWRPAKSSKFKNEDQ